MYTLNGNHSNYGVAEQTLSDGDSVVFHYTDNYTKERGGGTTENGQTTADLHSAAELRGVAEESGSRADVYRATGDYLETLGTPQVGAVGGEWMVIGLARSGRKVPGDYYDNVLQYAAENMDANERLHPAKSTDNARVILALTAIGKDVTDVDDHNLLLGLNDLNYLQKQGINGPIWALIALDAGNYPDPDGGDVTREALIRVILDAQLEDGGWALSGENADPDMTGMALQALAPYYDRSQAVQNAVDGAVALLSAMQDGNGGYSGVDGASCESIAQVIVALTALGFDPATDTRFVKNGISILDALMQYAVSDGGFRHDLTGERDGMATEQGYCALTAYDRFMRAKTALYMMTDVIDLGGDTVPEPVDSRPADTGSAEMDAEGGFPWEMVLTVLGIGAGVTAAAVWQKRIRQANSGT